MIAVAKCSRASSFSETVGAIILKYEFHINLLFSFQFQILSFVHFTDIGSTVSVSRHMTMLSAILIRLLCHYEIARFNDAAIALALISVELEIYTSDPAKWTCITRKLQLLAKVRYCSLNFALKHISYSIERCCICKRSLRS